MAHYGVGILALTFFVSCGNPANPPAPKWTSENPNASTAKPAEKPAAKSSTGTGSSLEAMQSGKTAPQGPLGDVYYAFDSAALSQSARDTLKANADWLKANGSARIQVEGHCDERGTAEYNMALGARRAQAALDYLASLGVAKDRMSTVSYGEEIPACNDHNEACWSKNRRARFVVSGK